MDRVKIFKKKKPGRSSFNKPQQKRPFSTILQLNSLNFHKKSLHLTFYDFRRSDGQSMFKKALLFDSWLFPLREEAEKLAKQNQSDASNKDVYFVNW